MPRYAHSGPPWVEITTAFTLDGLSYPANWPDLASAAQRNAAGVKAIVDDDTTPPTGKVFSAFAPDLVDVAGVPHRVAVFTDIPVPEIVSMMQAQLALNAAGLLASVETALAAGPAANRIYWNKASHLHRNHPLVLGLSSALSLTPAQVDALFVAAAGIT